MVPCNRVLRSMGLPHYPWLNPFVLLASAAISCSILPSIPTQVAGLDTSSLPPIHGFDESLPYKISLWLLAILITALSCFFGLWISGAVNLTWVPASSYDDGLVKNRARKGANGGWKDTWAVSPKACCNSSCCVNGTTIGEKQENQQLAVVPQPETSMMEQLVPEITQHMLSYLDYKSLCNVSMTNSSMRRAANDDTVWKDLFHKDFTVEQSCIVAPNGWKTHYAVTKAVLEVNRSLYKIFRAKSLRGMSRLWLHADYVKCIHPGGELLSGYDAVMDNWRAVFSWSQKFDFELHDERVRVLGDIAWVTLKEFVNSSMEPLLATNVYEFHDGHWFIVHRHSSPQLEGGNVEYGLFG